VRHYLASLDPALKRLRSLAAMQGGGGVPTFNDFLWDPTALTPTANVVATWAQLAPLIAAAHAQKRVVMRNKLGVTFEITPGTWPGITDVEFIAGGSMPDQAQLVVDDGAILPDTTSVRLVGVLWSGQSNSAPQIQVPANTTLSFQLEDGAGISSGGSVPTIAVEPEATFIAYGTNETSIGAGSISLADDSTEASVHMVGFGTVDPNAFVGGKGVLTLRGDSSSALNMSTFQAVTSVTLQVDPPVAPRPINLSADQTLEGPAPFTDIPGMQTTFTPLTAQCLVRITASVSPTPGAATWSIAARVSFAAPQSGALSTGSSSSTNSGGSFGSTTYEAVLSGLTPGIPASVTVTAQWATTQAETLQCLAGSDPSQYGMVMTIQDYVPAP
jgi:hypothetical protein